MDLGDILDTRTHAVLFHGDANNELVDLLKSWSAGRGVVTASDPERCLTLSAFLSKEGVEMSDGRDDGRGCAVLISASLKEVRKPLDYLVHLDLPKSIGAWCSTSLHLRPEGFNIVCYGLPELIKSRRVVGSTHDRRGLDELVALCESSKCRRTLLHASHGLTLADPCGKCDACLHPASTWDGRDDARIALGAAYRLEQKLTPKTLSHTLAGMMSRTVTKRSLQDSKPFGGGRHHPAVVWTSIYRQLVASNLARIDSDGFLKLEDGAHAVFQRTVDVTLVQHVRGLLRPDIQVEMASRRNVKSGYTKEKLTPDEAFIFDHLRSVRRRLADAGNAPPFTVCKDDILVAIAMSDACSIDDVAKIAGIRRRWADKYGEVFVAALREAKQRLGARD
jgi:ATP-dependent DNA helicase RecQ